MKVKYAFFCFILLCIHLYLLPCTVNSITVHDFLVNTGSFQPEDQLGGDVGLFPNGNFIVAWNDMGVDWNSRQIYFQWFDSLANPIGNPLLLSDSTIHYNVYPRIAIASSGNFAISWQAWDKYPGRIYNIWISLFDSSGNPILLKQQVDIDRPDADGIVEWLPDIAVDKNGNYIVVWATADPDIQRNVYAQRFSTTGERIGSNFIVSDSSSDRDFGSCHWPNVAFNSEGYFLICWQGAAYCRPSGPTAAVGRIYNPAGEPVTDVMAFIHPCASAWGGINVPVVASNSQNNFILSADAFDTLGIYPNCAIIVQTFDTLGNALDTVKVANDVIDMVDCWATPRIEVLDGDEYIILWSDQRVPNRRNLWVQRLNAEGELLGSNYRINTLPGSLSQPEGGLGNYYLYDFSIHENNMVAAWMDYRNWDTYGVDNYAKLMELDKVGYYLRGDVVIDGNITVSDIIYLINYLFKGGWEILPEETGDANADGNASISDVVYLINYIFKGGLEPPEW
jgi:hypothetical protein